MTTITATCFPFGVTGSQSKSATMQADSVGDISVDHIGEVVMEAIKNLGKPFPCSKDSVVLISFSE